MSLFSISIVVTISLLVLFGESVGAIKCGDKTCNAKQTCINGKKCLVANADDVEKCKKALNGEKLSKIQVPIFSGTDPVTYPCYFDCVGEKGTKTRQRNDKRKQCFDKENKQKYIGMCLESSGLKDRSEDCTKIINAK